MIKVTNDIYDINSTIKELQSKYIEEESDETLMTGIYGYLADIHSLLLQDSIILGSELGNELFPAKAKFEKNIIMHSIIQNITNINAKPAVMQTILGVDESLLSNLFVDNIFTIDKESPIYIEDYEFHLEYDLIITRIELLNGEYAYTARYDNSVKNNISDITNPYLAAPFVQVINKVKYIYFYCELMQVEHVTEYKKIISSSIIENKTFEFSFTNQLADFYLYIEDGDNKKYLTPIFEGVGIQNNLTDFCYYTYIDSETIRVRFDSISYMPSINADITVFIRTTQGSGGNFEYNTNFFTSINSEACNYNNLTILIMPSSNSLDGEDKKSIDHLRKLLPKEALSRGAITNERDLENYFNMLNIETNRTIIRKKVDNQFERSYFAYLLLKDEYNNVVPSNTIHLEIARSEFDTNLNRKYVLKPGCKILYDGEYGRIITGKTDEEIKEMVDNDKTTFIYTLPYTMVINGDPLYTSYYINLMSEAKTLEFTYINQKNALQFISTSITWVRQYKTDPDIYKLTVPVSMNTESYTNEVPITEYDENGKLVHSRLRAFAVIYNNGDTAPYRYKEGYIIEDASNNNHNDNNNGMTYNDETISYDYKFQFDFKTNDIINDDNEVRIEDVNVPITGDLTYGYFNHNISIKIYYVLEKGKDEEPNGRYDLDNIIPGLEDYTVTNMYTVLGDIAFYKNYTSVVKSVVSAETDIERDKEKVLGFRIKSVPVIRYSYADTEENMSYLISNLNEKKAYMDAAIILMDCFTMDFKLFNSYGPSKLYSIDSLGNRIIDRVNMTLEFELKLLQDSDVYTRQYIINDLKSILEDLNDIDDLHIPNIITTITNKYRNSIEYFEFLSFNGLGPGIQHLYRHESTDVYSVPEFLTVHTNNDMSPDINVYLA